MAKQLNRARGQRIKALREKMGWSVRKLALVAGVSLQAVYQWEAGKTIKPGNVDRLAEIFNVSSHYIYNGNGEAGIGLTPIDTLPRVPKVSLDGFPVTDFDEFMTGVQSTQEYVACHYETGDRAFAFQVMDESNAPSFRVGDTIIADPDREPIPGAYVLAVVDGREYVFRRYRKHADGFALVPENSDWPTLDSKDFEIAIYGVMTEFARPARY